MHSPVPVSAVSEWPASHSHLDPCARGSRGEEKLVKNEIEPYETMTLRYQGQVVDRAVQPISPDATVAYQLGSIVEVERKADVKF